MIMVYITCKDEKEAEKISRHLIKSRLIACANIFPIKSLYNWKGKLVDERESVIMAKSKKEKSEKIIEEVKKIHSYEIPAIEIVESKASSDYDAWVGKELS